MRVESRNRRVPRAPLPVAGVTRCPLTGRPPGSPQRTLLLLPRSYGLMRQTKSLPAPRWSLAQRRVLAGCRQSLLGDGHSRQLMLCKTLRRNAWHPYPAASLECTCPFLPREHRPHATEDAFGTRNCPCNATSTGSRISGLQSFVYLQAPTLARPPDCIHRSIFVLGGRAVYTTHRPGGYPFRDVASLRVRLGQFARRHGWTCTSWIAALSAAPCRIRLLDRWLRYASVAYPLVQEARRWPPPSLQGLSGQFGYPLS